MSAATAQQGYKQEWDSWQSETYAHGGEQTLSAANSYETEEQVGSWSADGYGYTNEVNSWSAQADDYQEVVTARSVWSNMADDAGHADAYSNEGAASFLQATMSTAAQFQQGTVSVEHTDAEIRNLLRLYRIDDGDFVEVDDGSSKRMVVIHPGRPLTASIQQDRASVRQLQGEC